MKQEGDAHFNGNWFTGVPGVEYYSDYVGIYNWLLNNLELSHLVCKEFILKDLWFIVYFVMGWKGANHKFIVDACQEIEDGPQTQTLDVWFREAGKSTVITIARSIQELLRNPNERICIFSYARSPAIAFLRAIKQTLETSELLKLCFPDILHNDPEKEALKWSEMEGLTVKRSGVHKEATVEAHGLLEGMPTGKHFSLLVFDDIVTADLVHTPEAMEKVKERFDMAMNVGTADGRHRVIGTFYHHEDPLKYVESKKSLDGRPLYIVRKKTATVDGTFNGESVFLPDARMDLLRSNRKQFYCQQLLDPTPLGEQRLDFDRIKFIQKDELPSGLFKFMVVDPAGSSGSRTDGRTADDWACWVVGVKPMIDDRGASDIYILDGFVDKLAIDDALNKIVLTYCNNGRILKLGVEKVGAMTFEIHVANALRAKGKHLSVESGSLHILNPSGRKKEMRIEQNIVWSLNNGHIHICSSLKPQYVQRLKDEMDKFPAWRDDALDAFAYVYDIIKDYKFGSGIVMTEEESRKWWEKEYKNRSKYNWMTA